jgi:hypothetical protein
MFSTSRFLPFPAAVVIAASVAGLSGSVSPAQDAAPAPAPNPPQAPAAPEPDKATKTPAPAAPAEPAAPATGAPSAVEAAKTGWDGTPALPSANLPASVGPRPAEAKTEAGGETAEKPEGPAMPDPLVAPLEEPPVPTDLVSDGAEPTPTESVVVNLINRLVERGVLTQGDAAELVSQAQRDAAVASQNAAAAALVAADAAMASEEDIVVTHIPEPVKDRLREEIREEILADLPAVEDTHFEIAESGKEAVMGGLEPVPAWVQKTRFFGDVRLRYDATRFPGTNDNTGTFPNFNRINTGEPFDVAGFEFSPQLNVDENRKRFRLRARAGFERDLDNGFMVGFRLATGNDARAVSVNQTLNAAFSKYEFWLDQAYTRWDGALGTVPASFSVGRFPNPFFHNSQIIWDSDLNFDGVVGQLTPELNESVRANLTLGAFPIFNTAFNFPDNQPDKFPSEDRYLYSGEAGVSFVADRDIEGHYAMAYHDFTNVEGRLSEPFVPLTPNDAGSTDELRPPFAQKGNTYMALRNIKPDPLNNFGTTNQFQYFGLATPYQILSQSARIDLNHWEPYQISLLADYAMNLGFDEERLEQLALNNRGPNKPNGDPGAYEGGNIAWEGSVQFGKPLLDKKWDWNTTMGYRYIESDSVIDGFNVSDFGLGGTNLEGFTIGANVALTENVFVHLRWMGASEITGPPLRSDIFFFDFNTSF